MSYLGTEVELTIVETIHYGKTFTIEELNEMCIANGITPYDPEGETGDLQAWLQDEASEALRKQDEQTNLLSEIEHDSGDVQGQTWEWEVQS